MTKLTWEAFRLMVGELVLLATEDLHMPPLTIPPTFMVGTGARRQERVELSLYRADIGDMPRPINVDTYEVWEALPGRIDVRSVVNAATTSTGPNLDRYL